MGQIFCCNNSEEREEKQKGTNYKNSLVMRESNQAYQEEEVPYVPPLLRGVESHQLFVVEASGNEVTQADFPIQRETFNVNLKIKFIRTWDET